MARRRCFLVEKGPRSGQRFHVEAERTVLGRGAECEIRLEDSRSSREHCAVEIRNGRPYLVDLGSRNGTLINGLPIEERKLEPGDRVSIGRTTLLYVEDEGESGEFEIAFEPQGSPARSISLSLDESTLGTSLAPEDLWVAGTIAAIYRTGTLAQTATETLPFFEGVLSALCDRLPVREAAMALVDPAARRLSFQTTRPAGRRFVAGTDLLDAVLDRKEVVLSGEGDEPRRIGVPLWLRREVGGLLLLVVDPSAGAASPRFLQLLGILGYLAGGTAQTLERVGRLEREKNALQAEVQSQMGMVGKSPAMRKVFALLERAAATDSTILVRGESGTGKELVARAIHLRSPRSAGPFLAVNAAALPLDLVESELFGHEKGAFTGATQIQIGKFEAADQGTFFLDEIGELDPRVQAKFLRDLEDGTFHRVGGTKTLATRARLLAATNRDLHERVREGVFREDLYFRLRVIEIVLPPLRERPEDIPLFVRHFLGRHAASGGREEITVSDEAMDSLSRYRWPGNVRELRNAIERAVVLAGSDRLELAHFDFLPEPAEVEAAAAKPLAGGVPTLQEVELAHILKVLEHAGGNKSHAARLLGIDRSTLYLKMKEARPEC
ncbi:MAG: sigma 54-dependent Fis family transcriptional regulator [Planctomycetes bacterium]|nr:sigma 54-dependent Fis family transcriptional regulator [Planctomycetota bacterium]